MFLLYSLDFSLPLKNPVLIFALILFIILFAPLILNRLKIPHLIGLIVAGALIGPNGFNLLLRDSSIQLFGTVGLLYIMFLAGLEIDMIEFKRNSFKSLVFGMFTFTIPMTIGTVVFYYILHYSLMSSVLIASMFASHTLVTYPILGRYGVTKNRAVNITVGGTIITDTLALLVLAVIARMATGQLSQYFWHQMVASIIVFTLIVLFIFPIIGRWFFKQKSDHISQYIFVLAMVFLGAFLAEAAGIEAIIGAFLTGLALNRLIPATSAIMNRIDFVGNALFIPFFLLGVGMLINFNAFVKGWDTIIVAFSMTTVALTAKFLAAWLTQKTFKFSKDERNIIFGLSNSQAAATLAAILVGYNIILNQDAIEVAKSLGVEIAPVRLLDENILNGTIVMILVTCTISSFATQSGAKNISLMETSSESDNNTSLPYQKILIPLNSIENIEEAIGLSVLIKSKKNKKGLFVLNVVEDDRPETEKIGKQILEKAAFCASATDDEVVQILRYDSDVTNEIYSVVKENKISDILLLTTKTKGFSENFLSNLNEQILRKALTTTIMVYKPAQPISTIKRHIVMIPDRAEREPGFPFWLIKMWNMQKNSGARFLFFASETIINYLKKLHLKNNIEADYYTFNNWEDFLIISRDIKVDDNLIIIMARKNQISYNNAMNRIPYYINKYFIDVSCLLIYPIVEVDVNKRGVLDNPSVHETIQANIDKFDDIAKVISNIFKRS